MAGPKGGARRLLTLRRVLLLLILFTVTGTVLALGVPWYITSKQQIEFLIREKNDEILLNAQDRIRRFLERAENSRESIDINLQSGYLDLKNRESVLSKAFLLVMVENPRLYWVVFGYPDGSSIGVNRVGDNAFRVVTVDWDKEKNTGTETITHYSVNEKGHLYRTAWSQGPSTFRADTRPWYREAIRNNGENIWTDEYVSQDEKRRIVITNAETVVLGDTMRGVLAVDVTLDELSYYLHYLRLAPHASVFLISRDSELIAFSEDESLVGHAKGGSETALLHYDHMKHPHLRHAKHFFEQTGINPATVQRPVTRAIRTETKEAMYVTAAPLDTMDWILCTVVPASDFFGYIYTSTRLMLLAVAALVVIATLVSLLVSSYILSGPIGRLTRKIERLARLRLDDTPYERSSIREIQEISDSIQRMEVALASFRKYVPADLVSDLLAKGRAATLSWEERDLSVIYTDIHRFRRQTRDLSPEEINVQFRAYLEAVTASVVENGGTVDKYMGDRVLAFWGAPDEMPDHPVHACRAALACRRRIAELNAAWEKEGRPVLPTTIGVNSGRMLVGNMGTEHRMSYSVIGDAVDLALRFAVSGQQFGLPILAGQTTREAVGDAFLFRPIDMLGGGEESAGEEGGGSVVFELAGLPTDDFYEEKNFLCSEFRIAFRAYQEHDFKAALRKFMEIRQRFPDDGPTQVYIDRCSRLRKESPGPNWEALVRTDSEIFDTIESDARHDAR